MIRTILLYVEVAPDVFGDPNAPNDVVPCRTAHHHFGGAVACVTDGVQFGYRMYDGSYHWIGTTLEAFNVRPVSYEIIE